ncbi:prephenate dehydratase [Aneurinibacillus aneurinilyticus]|uniref:Prephenate dehydratase n=1 Tax=Aneurinibacillus aneurinilyticus ATCC 12856 TaxID=649747 RepID=U1YL14_ANEAE|nr:prephenate dehydratase [Aneurinibacillus aneurinilyticus]ERI11496.1 prephenate dehydratase [Aneurinibacillus aneurinilyticus ATCC 12856]MED0709428.1 prephenate dehydratase [Aneurinibacillus aneurinilyticus]MED0724637.1 prephenate dehydratase [Aneurinibacillus aneurinilyticus]MED0732062.1 prephenate dehydratase [Aneurinibacillus aneurinilyticus]MED0740279.1 prephenate dehydratase [Aneurinibacillus aneurinilyticus]
MERTFAFLGPRGTNTEEAARLIFRGESDVFRPYRTIPDCLEAASEGKVDYAVVPWENSLEGSVNLTLDWIIHKIDLPILSELIIPISHQLSCAKREYPLALPDVTKVLSHPQAVAQCHGFLRDHLSHAEIEYVSSTAEAARLVSEHTEEPWVAISAMQAVHTYPVTLLKENIEDAENNFTRFIVLGEKPLVLPEADAHKTTILVTLPSDFPGALHQVLSAFSWRRLNLSRIESRPTKTGLGNYHFVIDIEHKMDDVLLPGAFAEMEALGCQVRFLGTYPVFIKKRNGVELSLRS